MLKMNNIPVSIFDANGVDDSCVKANGASISRKELVATGTLVAAEAMGQLLNARKIEGKEKFNSICKEKHLDYSEFSQKHMEKLLMYCATIANNAVGREAPKSFDDIKGDRALFHNETFLRTLAAITEDVVRPLIARFFGDLGDDLMDLHTIPDGGTYLLNVASNDVFIYEDSAIGAGHSATYQYLYDATLKIRAKSYVAQTKINWFQSIVNGGGIGKWYTAFAQGMWNKMYALFINALKTNASNTKYIPSGLVFNSYTSANFANATTKLAAVNNVNASDIIAYGSRTSLMNILPVDGSGSAITGLQYGLGKEWFEQGYLPNAGGVRLVEAKPVVVPYTQNTTIDTLDLEDDIYLFAKAASGVAPMQAVIEANTPFTVELSADKTADFTIDINTEARFNVLPVFANKGAIIKNV